VTRRIIFHIDVNSAYLSWEAVDRLQRGDPLDLPSVPAVMGGDPQTRHGIVLAKSIPAKKYGIQTGETLVSALSKCPRLIIVRPNYLLFQRCSQALREILEQYSPLIQQFSIDEYFLDYTATLNILGDPLKTAHRLRQQIKDELGFTVNIGISTNKLLAKMASEFEKPDKVHTLFPEEIKDKMWPLPVNKLFMVGPATTKKLLSRRIKTIGDLANYDPALLRSFLKSHGLLIWNYANGRENSPLRTDHRDFMKGLGNSATFPFDLKDRQSAHLALLSLAETVSARLRRERLCTSLVGVSLRTNEFYSCSHQRKFPDAFASTQMIWKISCELFDELWEGQPIRHLGIRVSELSTDEFIQAALFDHTREKQQAIDKAIDLIRSRFGPHAIYRSSFLCSGLKPLSGGVILEEDYPMMSSIL